MSIYISHNLSKSCTESLINYSEVTLNIVTVHVFLITEAGNDIYATIYLFSMCG